MIKTGFIKKIGEPREFVNKEGKVCYSYPVTVGMAYARQDGKTGEDELVCDHVAGNPEYVEHVKRLMVSGAECELTIAFAVREYNGRLYNSIRLVNISQRIVP